MDTIKSKQSPISWSISLHWAGINALSIFGGVLLGALLNEFLWSKPSPHRILILFTNPTQRILIIGLCIGVLSGIFEARLLRKNNLYWKGWIPANILGWGIGAAAFVSLAAFNQKSEFNHFIGGMIIGFFQWLVLRQHLPKSYWWIIVCGIGGFVLLGWIPLGYTFFMILQEQFVPIIIAGFIMGIITGLTLAWMLSLKYLSDPADH